MKNILINNKNTEKRKWVGLGWEVKIGWDWKRREERRWDLRWRQRRQRLEAERVCVKGSEWREKREEEKWIERERERERGERRGLEEYIKVGARDWRNGVVHTIFKCPVVLHIPLLFPILSEMPSSYDKSTLMFFGDHFSF